MTFIVTDDCSVTFLPECIRLEPDAVFMFSDGRGLCLCASAESLEPEVKILSLAIKSPDRSDIVLPIPENGNPKGLWFTLKEGSKYRLEFTFQVSNNIVSGLKYTNTVWKTAVKGNISLSLMLCNLIDGR